MPALDIYSKIAEFPKANLVVLRWPGKTPRKMRYKCDICSVGYDGCLSLKNSGKSDWGQNVPYPFLRGQPLKLPVRIGNDPIQFHRKFNIAFRMAIVL